MIGEIEPFERLDVDQHAWASIVRDMTAAWDGCEHSKWELCPHAMAAEASMQRFLDSLASDGSSLDR